MIMAIVSTVLQINFIHLPELFSFMNFDDGAGCLVFIMFICSNLIIVNCYSPAP